MTNKPFVDRLLALIKELANDNKKKFADLLEASPQNIDSWINRGSFPRHEHLKNLRDKLGVNINWLLTGKGPRYLKEEPDIKPAEAPAEYRTSEEREYCEKLVDVLRNPHTKKAIQENIDTFLKVPGGPERSKKNERMAGEEKKINHGH